jgi:hypothetical protein
MQVRDTKPRAIWPILVWISTLVVLAGFVDGELSDLKRVVFIVGGGAVLMFALHQPMPESKIKPGN